MENEEKFLPVGSVVLLKGGKKELMITSYLIFPTGELVVDGKKENPEGKMYDYGACTYPEGIINSDQIFGFNHDQIEKVCYLGYETDEHKKYSNYMTNVVNEIKKQIQTNIPQQQNEGN